MYTNYVHVRNLSQSTVYIDINLYTIIILLNTNLGRHILVAQNHVDNSVDETHDGNHKHLQMQLFMEHTMYREFVGSSLT